MLEVAETPKDAISIWDNFPFDDFDESAWSIFFRSVGYSCLFINNTKTLQFESVSTINSMDFDLINYYMGPSECSTRENEMYYS